MAHEFETGLFVSTPAWHGLGTVLDNAPDVDEALVTAGLNWRVLAKPISIAGEDAPIETHRAMVRSSDGAVLGVVGNQFEPLQNADAFDWFRPVVDSGEATIEAAGSLRGGRRVWILAALKNGTLDVQRGDTVKSYVLVAHGHDGSLAIRAGFTTVRVVCANTLAAAMGQDADNLVTLRHTAGAKVALEAARATFDFERAQLRSRVDQYRELARRGCDDRRLQSYVRETLRAGAGTDPDLKVLGVDKVAAHFEGGRGAELSRGTMWGAFNAVTEWVTHERGRNGDTRTQSAWFGDGRKILERALDVALEYSKDAPRVALAA